MKIYLAKSNDRESYASNIIIFEITDIKAEFNNIENSGVIIVQQINKGAFSDNEFVIKDYEDNKLVYVQKT